MRTTLIADLHLGHNRLTELDGRPVGFEQALLANVRRDALRGGIFLCLGDVSFYDHTRWHAELLAAAGAYFKRWLIRGNHDDKSINWYINAGWDFVGDVLKINNVLFTHRPVAVTTDMINVHGHLHRQRTVDLPGTHFCVYTDLVDLRSITNAFKAEPKGDCRFEGMCKACGEMIVSFSSAVPYNDGDLVTLNGEVQRVGEG